MSAAGPVPKLVDELRAARTRFGARWRNVKLDLLERIADSTIDRPRLLREYRDVLHFLAAYPDDPSVRRSADTELRRVASSSIRLAASKRYAAALRNTGLPGSVVEAPFSLGQAAWLTQRYSEDVDLAWEEESAGQSLDEFLTYCVPAVARDGLLDDRLTTRSWFRLARGAASGTDLAWLIRRLARLDLPPEILDEVFESLELHLRWRVGEGAAEPRFPRRRLFYHAENLQRQCDLPALLGRPLPAARPLPAGAAQQLIDVARTTLGLRQRETDPVTYANPREVTLLRLDRGIDVAIFGMEPDRRLPIESFFGYVAAKNTVPVAYGGGWVLGERSEIGINVFDTFRGGESAYLFGQILRVYHGHYHVRRFLVDPFQFGADNREGIRSGAFWFYYRFGFRPVDGALAQIAAVEWSKIRSRSTYRTPARTLGRLATGKLALEVGPAPDGAAPDPVALGLAVTRAVGRRFGGDDRAAQRWALRRALRLLDAGNRRRWPADERAAFERLALLVALLPGLDGWPASARRRLAALLRAKGGTREREYVRKVQSHDRFLAALHRLAATAPDDETLRNSDLAEEA